MNLKNINLTKTYGAKCKFGAFYPIHKFHIDIHVLGEKEHSKSTNLTSSYKIKCWTLSLFISHTYSNNPTTHKEIIKPPATYTSIEPKV